MKTKNYLKCCLLSATMLIGFVYEGLTQTKPNLGTAADYAILAGGSISSSDNLIVNGNVSSNQILPLGGANQSDNKIKSSDGRRTDGISSAFAVANLASAKAQLNNQNGNAIAESLSEISLGAGVYKINGNVTTSGTIKLTGSANSIYIFNISGDLNVL
jgi:hypothetical protein